MDLMLAGKRVIVTGASRMGLSGNPDNPNAPVTPDAGGLCADGVRRRGDTLESVWGMPGSGVIVWRM